MKNIQQKQNGFQKSASVERINELTAAIKVDPTNAVNLLSASIVTETDSAIKNWLIQFREAFSTSLTLEGVANV